MALKLTQKEDIVADVADVAATALSVVAADYRGLTSPEMTELRVRARETGVKLRIIRNTLARRAFRGTNFECLSDALIGPTLFAFSDNEPAATARLMRDFSKEHSSLEVKALSLDGKFFDRSHLSAVANLPTRKEALAKFLFVMQAPIVKLAQTISEPQAKLCRTFAAIRDDKQA